MIVKKDDKSLMEKAHILKRWGLSCNVLGFLILLPNVFSLDEKILKLFGSNIGLFIIAIIVYLLFELIMPRTKLSFLKSVIYVCLCIIAFYGLFWFSSTFNLNTGLVLSVASLAFGIFLQIWAEMFWQPESSTFEAVDELIDPIKHP